MKYFYTKGISVIESIIVIAVLIILIAVVSPQFSRMRTNQLLKDAVTDTLSALDKARGETLSSLNSSEYGVHFETEKIVIFKGTVYDQFASTNETILFEKPVSVSNVTFGGVSGNSGNVYFNRLLGAPSTTGTVTIYTTALSKIITISAAGMASSN